MSLMMLTDEKVSITLNGKLVREHEYETLHQRDAGYLYKKTLTPEYRQKREEREKKFYAKRSTPVAPQSKENFDSSITIKVDLSTASSKNQTPLINRNIATFPCTDVNQTSKLVLTLMNRSASTDCNVKFTGLCDGLFSTSHSELAILPRRFVKLPLKFMPKFKGHFAKHVSIVFNTPDCSRSQQVYFTLEGVAK